MMQMMWGFPRLGSTTSSNNNDNNSGSQSREEERSGEWSFSNRNRNSNAKVGSARKGKRRVTSFFQGPAGNGIYTELASPMSSVASAAAVPVKTRSMDEAMNVAETKQGIEVSLDWSIANADAEDEERQEEEPPNPPEMDLADQIRHRLKVVKMQFSVNFPMLNRPYGIRLLPRDRKGRRHRVGLSQNFPDEISYQDKFVMLENYMVTDEMTAVQEELKHMNIEIEALEEEKAELERQWLRGPTTSPRAPVPTNNAVVEAANSWDVRRLLNAKRHLTIEEQSKLQEMRGLCLTLHLANRRAQETFIAKCGIRVGRSRSSRQDLSGVTVSLTPNNCRPGGAGETIRHVAVLNSCEDSNSAFFVSRDSGKSYLWGHLPPKLYRRMKQKGLDPHQGGGDLVYLSTGPLGCYFAEFRSGECWWGNAVDDSDFHSIVQRWDVYRVVFGPITPYMDDKTGEKKLFSSWIVLGRDGRAAWKNLPSRLHHLLERRLANWAAPAEVALGSGDSYFIRFLDGTTDYCLPARIADVCENIERQGGMITDVALHPEVSHDFVIRHTAFKS
jgi:hypothetical protein